MNNNASVLYTTAIAGVAMAIIFYLLNKAGLLNLDGFSIFTTKLQSNNPTY